MTVLAVLGGVAVAGIAAAALWDHKQHRHGSRTDVSRRDIELREGQRWPSLPEDDHQ
jgi:hypothetical protein